MVQAGRCAPRKRVQTTPRKNKTISLIAFPAPQTQYDHRTTIFGAYKPMLGCFAGGRGARWVGWFGGVRFADRAHARIFPSCWRVRNFSSSVRNACPMPGCTAHAHHTYLECICCSDCPTCADRIVGNREAPMTVSVQMVSIVYPNRKSRPFSTE